MNTYKKIIGGVWGGLLDKEPQPGDVVVLTAKSGKEKSETVSKVISSGDGKWFCSFVARGAQRQKHEDKIKKRAEWELNAKTESERLHKEVAHEVGIMAGSPILRGHHSEGRHRNAINRVSNKENRAYEREEMAKTHADKGETLQRTLNNIYSDDPNAIPRLESKIEGLETKREQHKSYNKQARKDGAEQLPTFELTNLSQNINQQKKRLARLKRIYGD